MGFEVLTTMFLLPLLLAGVLICTIRLMENRPGLIACLFGSTVLVLFVINEGIPPFPPISAKQKIPYLFILMICAVLIIGKLNYKTRVVMTLVFLAGSFLWLVQRQLMIGTLHLKWILPLLVIPVFTFAVHQQSKGNTSRFAWPMTLLVAMITTSLVALLGGFVGVGQLMLTVSVCFGGVVLGLFGEVLFKKRPELQSLSPAVLWIMTVTFGVILILIGSFATNLSTLAYLLTLTIMLVPLADGRIARHPLWLHPFLFAVVAAVFAGPAIILAVFNF